MKMSKIDYRGEGDHWNAGMHAATHRRGPGTALLPGVTERSDAPVQSVSSADE